MPASFPSGGPSADSSLSWPKTRRLRARRDFVRVQGKGRRIHTRHFLWMVLEGESAGRVGITVSKRVGNAVVRNRIRRWVREYMRARPGVPGAGQDVVVIAKRSASGLKCYAEVEQDLARASI